MAEKVGKQTPTQQVAALRQEFEQEQNHQGVISRIGAKGIDLFKRTFMAPFGNEDNSASIKGQLAQLDRMATQIEQNGGGSGLAAKQFQNQVRKTTINLEKFHHGNEVGGSISKAATITGAVAVGTALAPVTGGASLAVGVGLGVAASEATGYVDKNTSENRVTLNPLDGNNRFTKKEALNAGITGAASGLIGPMGKTIGSLAVRPLQSTISQGAASILKSQIAGGLSGGGSEFMGALTKHSTERGQLDGKALQEGLKAVPAGVTGGIIGGTFAGATKLKLGENYQQTASTLSNLENTATRKLAVATFNGFRINPLRRP